MVSDATFDPGPWVRVKRGTWRAGDVDGTACKSVIRSRHGGWLWHCQQTYAGVVSSSMDWCWYPTSRAARAAADAAWAKHYARPFHECAARRRLARAKAELAALGIAP